MLNIREIPPEQWAALVRFLGPYATGGQFRPVPLRQVRAVLHRVLGLRTEAGAYTDKPNARGIRLNNGLDPVTFEVIDQASFELAVGRAIEAVVNVYNKKQSQEPDQSNGKNDEGLPKALTQGVEDQVDPMLREIGHKLGPAVAPLKPLDPKSLYRPPKPAPPTASEKFATSDRSLADLSAECALRVRQRFGNL